MRHSAVAVATDGNKMDPAVQGKADRRRCRDREFRPSLGGEWGVGLAWDSGCAEVTGHLSGLGVKEWNYGDC